MLSSLPCNLKFSFFFFKASFFAISPLAYYPKPVEIVPKTNPATIPKGGGANETIPAMP